MWSAGTTRLTYGTSDDEEHDLRFSEEDSKRKSDPCFHYTVLDQAWRATNSSTKLKMCDRNVKWKGDSTSCTDTVTSAMKTLILITLFDRRLVPPLLQGSEHPDARAVRPCEQVQHPRPLVADWASPQEEGGHRHPPGLRPLEEELLRLQIHRHPGQEVPRQLLRVQVHPAGVLWSGLLRGYVTPERWWTEIWLLSRPDNRGPQGKETKLQEGSEDNDLEQ